jgi:hypothetical protein
MDGMTAARVLLAGAASEARGGNMFPWPYAGRDIEAAARALGWRPNDTEEGEGVSRVMLALAWSATVEWVDRPEVRRAIEGMARALMVHRRPPPELWWRLCQEAAAELHPPEVVANMAAWPGAKEAGAPWLARVLAERRRRALPPLRRRSAAPRGGATEPLHRPAPPWWPPPPKDAPPEWDMQSIGHAVGLVLLIVLAVQCSAGR